MQTRFGWMLAGIASLLVAALVACGGGAGQHVAVFGVAAMFTEQICGTGLPMGMNAPAAAQNGRFLINLVRWLFGEL